MQSKLKICGIATLDDAIKSIELGVHWLGFNFYPGSPRYIEPEKASEIINKIKNAAHCVGIFVEPTFDEVDKMISTTNIHRAQIYHPKNFKDLSSFKIPTIICYRINQDNTTHFKFMGADMMLVDSYSKTMLGGSGETFNWELIPDEISREKLILAGGITTENIGEALRKVKPAIIDVASGSEIKPGKKDFQKIKQLMNELNRFNNEEIK